MRRIKPSLYKNKVKNPKETIYEIITEDDGLGWGLAIADIVESEAHLHKKTREVYIGVEGELEVTIGDELQVLKPGDCLTIEPGTTHKARAAGHQPTRIVAFTYPAWSPKDHLLIKKS